MYTLGINYLSESSVCLFKNNELIYAISEERINRKKIGMEFQINQLINF